MLHQGDPQGTAVPQPGHRGAPVTRNDVAGVGLVVFLDVYLRATAHITRGHNLTEVKLLPAYDEYLAMAGGHSGVLSRQEVHQQTRLHHGPALTRVDDCV